MYTVQVSLENGEEFSFTVEDPQERLLTNVHSYYHQLKTDEPPSDSYADVASGISKKVQYYTLYQSKKGGGFCCFHLKKLSEKRFSVLGKNEIEKKEASPAWSVARVFKKVIEETKQS